MARTLTLPSQAKRRRQASFYRKIILIIVFSLLLLGGLVYGLRLSALRIDQININGQESVNSGEVETVARNDLAGRYLYLLPRDSIFFYPKSKIENSLLSSFKSLNKVEISVQNLHSINIQLFERVPHYVWCTDSAFSDSESGCYFLDNDGLIFNSSPEFSGNVYIRFYGVLLGEGNDVIGKSFLTKDLFKQLDAFMISLKDKVFSLVRLVKNNDDDYELYIKDGGKIIFSLKGGAEKPLSNLFSAIETDPLKSALIGRPKDLEYIDLRFGNKVFFKFK